MSHLTQILETIELQDIYKIVTCGMSQELIREIRVLGTIYRDACSESEDWAETLQLRKKQRSLFSASLQIWPS